MRTLHERKNKCIRYFLFFAGDLRDGVSSCQRYLLRLPSSREAAHDNAVASSLASRAADVRAPDSDTDTNIEAPRLKIQRLATFSVASDLRSGRGISESADPGLLRHLRAPRRGALTQWHHTSSLIQVITLWTVRSDEPGSLGWLGPELQASGLT